MNWNDFLISLKNAGDKETADFLAAMKQISEITVKDLEHDEKRSAIDSQIKIITDYKNKYGDRLYELGRMRGFRTNGERAISGGDYYYYIADQKMKAAVYYARFLNILENNQNMEIAYIKYLMLNNMMREVRFFGASYQYLWHWEKKQAHLFRNVSSTEPSIDGLKADGIKVFFEAMFNMVIDQMNKSRENTFSYSTDPFIDIFKYLKIKKSDSEVEYSSDGIKLFISDITNDSTAKFEIITNAEINSVFYDSNAYDYYSFIQKQDKLFAPEREYPFAVELYPALPEKEKNEKGTTTDIKDLIYNYLKSWNRSEIAKLENNRLKHIGSWVADDKEVVTCGTIVTNKVKVSAGSIPTVKDKTSYHMELSKEDVIYLMLKLMKADQNITESFDFEFESQLKQCISKWIKKVKGATADGSQPDDFLCDSKIIIDKELKITVSSIDPKPVSNNTGTIDECVKAVSNKIIKIIKEYFTNRYKSILESEHKVADFILDFISQKRYKCPDYIYEYNEFSRNSNDTELVLLKKILFKKGTK